MIFTHDLMFYGPKVIDHFMCDFLPLLEIACSDTYRLGLVVATNGGACACSFFHATHILHSHPDLPEIPWL